MFQKPRFGKLEIAVLIVGASIMTLELVGSRLFAPYLGTSIYVWTALIAVVLAFLSLGYTTGGKLSRQNPNIDVLAMVIFLAALAIWSIILIKAPILAISSEIGIKAGSISATIGLFGVPVWLLGFVVPYAVRLRVNDISTSGDTAGKLYAISTSGSIIGTLLAGFIIIPTFSLYSTIIGISIVLVFVSLMLRLSWYKFAVLVIMLITIAVPLQAAKSKFIFETDSAYNHIIVSESKDGLNERPLRALVLGKEIHSIIYSDNEDIFPGYQELYRLDSLFKSDIKTALTMGGGAYISPVDFLKRYPSASMTVVELDQKVTEVAKEYFNVPPNLQIIHEDARVFLNTNLEKFDVIYGDVFLSSTYVPFHLTTVEAVQKIYDSLSHDGLYILNIIGGFEGKYSDFFKAEYHTIASVFPGMYVFQTRENPFKVQNIVIIATKSSWHMEVDQLFERATNDQRLILEKYPLYNKIVPKDLPILTDDYAPVEEYMKDYQW